MRKCLGMPALIRPSGPPSPEGRRTRPRFFTCGIVTHKKAQEEVLSSCAFCDSCLRLALLCQLPASLAGQILSLRNEIKRLHDLRIALECHAARIRNTET